MPPYVERIADRLRDAENDLEPCTFCSYANGVIAYVRRSPPARKQYWCPIKRARVIPTPHRRYHSFFDYGDARGYRHDLSAVRRPLRGETGQDGGRRTARPGHDHGGR